MRIVFAAAAVAIAPASAFAVDYLTADQAAKLMFPEADRFETREIALDTAQMQKLDAQGVRARSTRWQIRQAQRGTSTVGFVVVDEVIGKFELITYAVAVGLDGAVKQVEVLAYRESHGHEIRLAAWRRQFVGKTSASPMRVGEDIANISGATLSCNHVAEGIRRIVNVLGIARSSGALS
jgi:Na+-translocating ferredoxin:NAD+ oxidoreductase RnfG subunit